MTAEQILDSTVDPACEATVTAAEAAAGIKTCYEKYEVSSDDYDSFSVTLSGTTYSLSVSPKTDGKFDGVTETCTDSWSK